MSRLRDIAIGLVFLFVAFNAALLGVLLRVLVALFAPESKRA